LCRCYGLRRPAGLFLCLLYGNHVLDATHDIRRILAESLGVECGDEFRQRLLPKLLTVVVQAAEFFWIHSEFAGHLHVGM
jgi:hypothetical protein